MTKFLGFMGLVVLMSAALSVIAVPSHAGGGGGTGGGGATKVTESRITGYVTAIDYDHSTITVGASYYGNGSLIVTSATKGLSQQCRLRFQRDQTGRLGRSPL